MYVHVDGECEVNGVAARSRELRSLAPLEALAIAALAIAPLGDTFPIALPLLVTATASRWLRRRAWREVVGSPRVMLPSALAGALALAIATPLHGAFSVTAVDWWVVPALHGELAQLVLATSALAASAIALELALRGWIIERMLELSPGPPALPIAVAALAEALVTAGPVASRIGVALFGAGLGLLYVASGRNVLAPIAARVAFVACAIIAELASS